MSTDLTRSGWPAPRPSAETREFWERCNERVLLLTRCLVCDAVSVYPRLVCGRCRSAELSTVQACGRASLYTYVINHHQPPGYGPKPYVVAIVELDEGPRYLTNLAGIEPDPAALELGMALELDFEPRGDQLVPVFRPAAP